MNSYPTTTCPFIRSGNKESRKGLSIACSLMIIDFSFSQANARLANFDNSVSSGLAMKQFSTPKKSSPLMLVPDAYPDM